MPETMSPPELGSGSEFTAREDIFDSPEPSKAAEDPASAGDRLKVDINVSDIIENLRKSAVHEKLSPEEVLARAADATTDAALAQTREAAQKLEDSKKAEGNGKFSKFISAYRTNRKVRVAVAVGTTLTAGALAISPLGAVGGAAAIAVKTANAGLRAFSAYKGVQEGMDKRTETSMFRKAGELQPWEGDDAAISARAQEMAANGTAFEMLAKLESPHAKAARPEKHADTIAKMVDALKTAHNQQLAEKYKGAVKDGISEHKRAGEKVAAILPDEMAAQLIGMLGTERSVLENDPKKFERNKKFATVAAVLIGATGVNRATDYFPVNFSGVSSTIAEHTGKAVRGIGSTVAEHAGKFTQGASNFVAETARDNLVSAENITVSSANYANEAWKTDFGNVRADVNNIFSPEISQATAEITKPAETIRGTTSHNLHRVVSNHGGNIVTEVPKPYSTGEFITDPVGVGETAEKAALKHLSNVEEFQNISDPGARQRIVEAVKDQTLKVDGRGGKYWRTPIATMQQAIANESNPSFSGVNQLTDPLGRVIDEGVSEVSAGVDNVTGATADAVTELKRAVSPDGSPLDPSENYTKGSYILERADAGESAKEIAGKHLSRIAQNLDLPSDEARDRVRDAVAKNALKVESTDGRGTYWRIPTAAVENAIGAEHALQDRLHQQELARKVINRFPSKTAIDNLEK